ncbi:1-phosphatidylinositol-4,5-bisphosphate phosphodiesterase 1 [Vararia minispora EC-137]|uniref:1-phosphatidylinositol-4,5-bisphosphate phosphodiesterase 1 n=1 Tax=Vararia minispora EC-137 TaxID=1314806 RepID=A0ACB8QEY3_9AGAM|nr:1-phosphatidylinositol-4,5-bisphosphate phosphodiesterase 1 [Vararia minispora EC-137]
MPGPSTAAHAPTAAPAPPERGAPVAQPAQPAEFSVPLLLQQGTPMTKVSHKKQRRIVFRLDPDQGQIIWESKKHRIIPIENVRELRTGEDARFNREQFQLAKEYEARWITIIYTLDGEWKTLHVIAPSTEVFHLWDTTLRQLYDIRRALMSGEGRVDLRETLWERQYWKGADDEADQKLYFEDVEKLCKRLSISPSREDLMRRFQQADGQQRGYLDFAGFQRFVKLLKSRPEIDRLYKRLAAANGGHFTYAVFERFMRHHQKSMMAELELKRLFLRYASCPTLDSQYDPPQNPLDLAFAERPSAKPASPPSSQTQRRASLPESALSVEAFTAFLLSPENAPFADPPGQVVHDMTRPLAEYFISSSHNTYLVGNQITGETTVEGYIRALLHSCRSVELDIYDGETEPFVYHGKTLTRRVPLRDICRAISKYAFVVSAYPVIISAEVHCSVPQQEIIVSIMHDTFGDALVSAPPENRPKVKALPSPEELRGRVLLKAKNLFVADSEGTVRPKEITLDAESSSTATTTTATEDEDESPVSGVPVSSFAPLVAGLSSDVETKGELPKTRGILSGRRSRRPEQPARGEAKQKVRMSMALVSLLVYTVGVKCRGLNKKEQYAPEHVFSLSENTVNKMFKRDGMMADLIKHCRTHVVRVYPKGMRVNSTNYEPHRYWSAGCQLVAINWQTCDLGYMINHAMFQRNGRSGYVLKPLALRSADKGRLLLRTQHFFDVTIVSAQQLPRPKSKDGRKILDKAIMDPLVEVSVHVPDWMHSSSPVPGAGTPQELAASVTSPARTVSGRTTTVKNNGFNPVWEEELSLPFDVIGGMRDLVFVRFAVREAGRDDDEPLAVYCASLGSLREGFRHLPLHDSQLSQYLFSTLFVRIGIRDVS